MYALTHRMVCLWFPVVNFRESALVKHSFYEKLSDNDLLLTNANALLSVQYRYHALSLVSVI